MTIPASGAGLAQTSKPPLLLISNRAPATTPVPGEAPREDFAEVARALGGAPLLYASPRSGPIAALEERAASDLRQALTAFRQRRRHGVFISFSEKVGLPLALLLGRRHLPHIIIAHNLTSERKKTLQKRTGYLHRFDQIVVLCEAQRRYLIDDAKVDPKKVNFVEYMVDRHFWTRPDNPDILGKSDGPILSVGRERRDYETLALAARRLPHRKFVIVASSPWSRSREIAGQAEENLDVRRNLRYGELRELYASALAVVVPLEKGTQYAAGVTGVLEAMAMGHSPIVARTPGIADYIDDGVNGRGFAAGDPESLSEAIEAHLGAPEAARRMGAAGRAMVVSRRNMETYVANLAQIVDTVREN